MDFFLQDRHTILLEQQIFLSILRGSEKIIMAQHLITLLSGSEEMSVLLWREASRNNKKYLLFYKVLSHKT